MKTEKMDEIKDIKFAMSKLVPMFALKWSDFPGANKYKIMFSNGKKPEYTSKPLYRIPSELSVETTMYIQAYNNDKKISKKTIVNSQTTNIILIG